MGQERLEQLLMMAIERNITNSIDRNETIDRFGKSPAELSKLLIR